MSLGKEMMSRLCQRFSTLTSRKFILVPDPSLSAAEAPLAHCPPQSLAPVLKLIASPPLCWLCGRGGVIL